MILGFTGGPCGAQSHHRKGTDRVRQGLSRMSEIGFPTDRAGSPGRKLRQEGSPAAPPGSSATSQRCGTVEKEGGRAGRKVCGPDGKREACERSLVDRAIKNRLAVDGAHSHGRGHRRPSGLIREASVGATQTTPFPLQGDQAPRRRRPPDNVTVGPDPRPCPGNENAAGRAPAGGVSF
jgi:hypothetical protein